jgi:uncharacterized protein YcbK (DUF882 family)
VPRTNLRSAFSAAAILLVSVSAHAETTHVVAAGQTLGRIAKRYHVTVDALREANDLKPGQAIHPGLELTVPEPGDAPPKRPGSIAKGAGRSPQAARGEDFARRPKKPGTVHFVRGDERLDLQLLVKKGKLNAPALGGLSSILRFGPNGAKVSVDPRLATLIAMVSDHFGGRPLHVVSGFRPYSPTQYTPHSNHNVGRAIDFFVEGVPNTALRDYCRQFHDAGVGFYPNSTFVHLDVRSGQTYWVDYSKAGEAPRYEGPAPATPPDEARRDVEPVDAAPADQGTKSNVPDSAMGQ